MLKLHTCIPLLIAINFALTCSNSFAVDVAITVDDLPLNGDLPASESKLDQAKKMLAVFNKHHVTEVYGLINGSKVDAEGQAVLNEWVKQGQLLGNHTYNHLDLAKVDALTFISNRSVSGQMRQVIC